MDIIQIQNSNMIMWQKNNSNYLMDIFKIKACDIACQLRKRLDFFHLERS